MTPIQDILINNKTTNSPIWLMRQAGRYLPEFRNIRSQNPNFINLCLNETLSSEITLQPIERFNLDAAIIFSDILMLPFGLNQKVDFKKDFGPQLGNLNLEEMSKLDEIDFIEKLYPIYKSIKKVSQSKIMIKKDLIGFVGSTGRSEAPHLRYEVFKDKKRINPINFYYGNLSPKEFADKGQPERLFYR